MSSVEAPPLGHGVRRHTSRCDIDRAGALRCLRGDRWRVCDRFWTTVDARRGTRLPPLSLAVVRYAELGDTGTVPIHCIQVTGGGPAEAR